MLDILAFVSSRADI